MRRDPVLAAIIKQHGHCALGEARDRFDHFTMLVRAIVFQQLSTKAATTIYNRLLERMPDGVASPHALSSLTDDQLRAAGISRQKASYLRDLGSKVAAGDVPLDALDALADEDIITALTKVKGIGRWTAEMFLIFRLQRPDVLPVNDLGILNAIQKAYRLRKKPTAKRLRQIGEPWRPYRSIACWYLWRSLEPPAPSKRPAPSSTRTRTAKSTSRKRSSPR
jgi:DNA-3-methyladenine glycosylase II